ncbi:hypothetical protein ABL78_3459 [Leptomonas seymouri]|uniref:Uncharacterized protein n=1 Tax=Leptomonas seymouri TaxID=5684 RepID=A0A0N1PEQ5_LEPSE|nr:hypothetical protein ABL78_3459 [Leptomonas seymouri]|eukprot:KPI87470.1 hypothetical protein ABL78_3459 [Leptomonas seymouri]
MILRTSSYLSKAGVRWANVAALASPYSSVLSSLACEYAMSAGLSQTHGCGSAEALDNHYLHLNTQLLAQLQSGDVLTAMQTAEAIRALCLNGLPQADTNTAAPSTQAMAQGAKLFRGSPAERLLSMQSELVLSFGQQQEQLLSETQSSSSPPSTQGEDPTSEASDTDLHTSSTQSESSDTSSSASSSEEQEEREVGNRRTNPSQPLLSLAEALTKWAQGIEARQHRPQPSQAAHAPTAHVHAPVRPSPPPSKPQLQRCRPEKNKSRPKDVNSSKDCTALAERNAGGRPQHDTAIVDAEAEADEMWERMQQEVAKEMERLAVVRKHR